MFPLLFTHTSNTTMSKHKISPLPQISTCPCSESPNPCTWKTSVVSQAYPPHLLCQQTLSALLLNLSRHLHHYHPLQATSWGASHCSGPLTDLFSTQQSFETNAFLRVKAQMLTVPRRPCMFCCLLPSPPSDLISLLSLLLSSHQPKGHVAACWICWRSSALSAPSVGKPFPLHY